MKKFLAILSSACVLLAAISALGTGLLVSAASTRPANSWTDAQVLAPGCRDEITPNAADGNVPLSDYAYVGSAMYNKASSGLWLAGFPVLNWDSVEVNRFYTPVFWASPSRIAYKVQVGSYVTIPLGLGYHSSMPWKDQNALYFNLYTIETSADGNTYTAATGLSQYVEQTNQTGVHAKIQYTTLKIPEGIQYIRVTIPTLEQINENFGSALNNDSYGGAGVVFVAPARAYATNPNAAREAAPVDALIEAIGTVELTTACKTKIDAARTAYDALDADCKAAVTKLSVLTAAESSYAALQQSASDATLAEQIDTAIDAIGTVEGTEACKAKIDAARAAYDGATAAVQAKVTKLSVLTAAEADYAVLRAAADVDAAIEAIGTVDATDTCKGKIDAARAAYTNLSEAAKAHVTKLAVLTKAESDYAALAQETARKLTEKPFEPNVTGSDNSTFGAKARLVDLDGSYAVVRVTAGQSVTLQQVLDGLVVEGTLTVKFYKGENEVAASAKAENGIVLKALRPDDSLFASYTIQLYNDVEPTGETKKVLKPGVMDVLKVGDVDNKAVSDYATTLGELASTDMTGPGWLCDHSKYAENGQQWGQANNTYYAVWWKSSGNGLQYQVVPDSYVAIPLVCRGEFLTLTKDNIKDIYNQLTFDVSKDGSTWQALPEENLVSFLKGVNSYRVTTFVSHIPEGYHYLRILLPAGIYDPFGGAGGTEWYRYGYCLGMAKASWTPITATSTGDVLRGWYDEGSITSNNTTMLSIGYETATVTVESGKTVTLAQVKSWMTVGFGEAHFYTAQGTEITDLSTAVAEGQLIKGLSKGNSFMADGEVFAQYTLAIKTVEKIETPVLSSNDANIVIDETAKTITAKYFADEPMTYQTLMKALKVTYGELMLADDTGAAFSKLDAQIDGGVNLKVAAKSCPGVTDGTITATYAVVADKRVKEVVFASKDESKVRIDEGAKQILIAKGMTYAQLLENLNLQYAEVVLYNADMEEIQDKNTVIDESMGMDLVLSVTTVYYEFGYLPASGNSEPSVPPTGEALPLAALAVLGAAAAGCVLAMRKKNA